MAWYLVKHRGIFNFIFTALTFIITNHLKVGSFFVNANDPIECLLNTLNQGVSSRAAHNEIKWRRGAILKIYKSDNVGRNHFPFGHASCERTLRIS
jgi:hypothetical protein